MTQIRKKIQSLKIKIKNFDLENTGENEDKFLQDDLNYYKEKKILLKAELELINKKYEKIIVSKRNEQKETEQKLIIKSEKLQRIIEETENYILKIKEMKNEIVRMSDKLLVEDKEKKQKPENNL